MKKIFKKTTILLLVICTLVSIINILKVSAEEPRFILSEANIIEKSDEVDSTISSFSGDSLNIETTFHKLNEYVNYKLTIKNNSDENYKLISVSDNNSNDYIKNEYEYTENEELSGNNTIDINMKSIYENELDNINNRNQIEEFIISIVFEDEEGNIDNRTIIINPETHTIAGVSIYYYLLIISIGLLLLLTIKSKKKKKILLLLVLMPILARAISSSLSISVSNNVALMDKLIVNKTINGQTTQELINYNTKLEEPEEPEIEGYNFEGWYSENELFDFSKEITEDTEITAKLTPIEYRITYNLDGGTVTNNPDKYTIETESFDLNNPTKEGYSFSGWTGSNGSNLQTRVTIEQGSTGDKTYTANYSPNESTHYKVNHKYTKLDGTYEVEEEDLYGTTGTTVTPAFRSRTGFDNPPSQQITIEPDGDAFIDYIYTRTEYQLTINNIEDVDTSFENKKYPYETQITMTAKDKDHYNFVKWSNGVTTKTLSFEITEDTTVGPEYELKEYTVSFDAQGGVDVNPITKPYNSPIGELSEGIRPGYRFEGWFTEIEGGEQITENITYYAHWTKIICKPATTLHTETCKRTSGGCYAAGYSETGTKKTKTIVYGTIPNSETKSGGFAYDCDVNGDGTYDSDTERFYYLTTNESNAVLISHNHFEGENGQISINNYTYDKIYDQLPTSEQWSNLPILFNDKPARIPTYNELKAACGKNTLTATGDLDRCTYLMENTRFRDATKSQEGVWLEKINGTTYRYHTNTRKVTSNTQENGVRPVIEVPLENIDETYYTEIKRTITFDSQGGSEVESIQIDAYTQITTLPTPNKEESDFGGWFTQPNGKGTQILENTVITDDMTLYALWITDDAVEVNGEQYSSLEVALQSHVPTDGTETTIKLLKDLEAEATVQNGQNIIIEFQGFKLSNKTTEPVLTNYGTIKISNGTITTKGQTAAINNESDGVLIMTGGEITSTGSKQCIYNFGGRVELSGSVYLKNYSNQRAAFQNLENGTAYIKGGTIISDKQQAVNNESGTLIIGEEDGTYNVTSPVLKGKTYGLTTAVDISMYDGILEGQTAAIDDQLKIVNFEENHTLTTGTDGSYKTLYFER